jgi:RHS repeat-associated protein
VKKVKPDGSKTLYAGGIFEVDKTSGGTVTRTVSYCPLGGATLAPGASAGVRINISGGSNTLYYLLKDHLGSASVVTDASGTILGEDRFYPYGETRFTTGTMYTDQLFTGQREMTGLGLYHYGARFYSPKLGRFLSPDTIIPGMGNLQAFNRYSYGLNNPSRYTDPTGHMAVSDTNEAGCSGQGPSCIIGMYGGYDDDDGMMDSLRNFVRDHEDYNPQADPELSLEDQSTVSIAMFQVAADDAAHTPNMSLSDILRHVLPSAELTAFYSLIVGGPPDFNMMPDEGGGGSGIIQYGEHTISKSTLKELGVTEEQLHFALRDIKQEYGLSNSFHGNIAANGDYIDPSTGNVLGNIYDYLP